MADQQRGKPPEPLGFGEHTRGLPGEYAHEQGWELNEEERRRQAASPRDTDGGNDYNYSAQDFGDEPANMARMGADEARAEEAARRALGLDDSDKTSQDNHGQKENR
jgi:hypothetical protein